MSDHNIVTQFTNLNGGFSKLTEKEREVFEGLVNPDAPKPEQFRFNRQLQQEVLSLLLGDDGFLKRFGTIIEHEFFVEKSHEAIAKIILELWREHGTRPSATVITEEINRRYPDGKALIYAGEVEACRQIIHYESNRSYLEKRIMDFISEATGRIAVNRYVDDLVKGKVQDHAEYFQTAAARIKELTIPTAAPHGKSLAYLRALNITWDWLIERYLLRGNHVLIPADAKSGKTTFLLWLCRQMQTGAVFGEKATPCPVIYLDFEEGEKLFTPTVTTAMDGAPDFTFEYFSKDYHDEAKLPPYLATEFLDRAIEGKERGLIIVDTFRRAFQRSPLARGVEQWQRDEGIISQLLTPITDWCHATGWTMFTAHHTNKVGVAAGSNDFRGVCDAIWTFDIVRNPDGKKTTERSLMIEHRPPPVEDLIVTYQAGRYEYLCLARDFKEVILAAERPRLYTAICEACEHEHKTRAVLVEALKSEHGVRAIAKALDWLEESSIVSRPTLKAGFMSVENWRDRLARTLTGEML